MKWLFMVPDADLKLLYQQTRYAAECGDPHAYEDTLVDGPNEDFVEFKRVSKAVATETWRRFGRPLREWPKANITCEGPGPHRLVLLLPLDHLIASRACWSRLRCACGGKVQADSEVSWTMLIQQARADVRQTRYSPCECAGTLSDSDFVIVYEGVGPAIACVFCGRKRPAV